METDDNKRAIASKILINQLFMDVYGEDIESIEEKERNQNEDFHFSTKNFDEHGNNDKFFFSDHKWKKF